MISCLRSNKDLDPRCGFDGAFLCCRPEEKEDDKDEEDLDGDEKRGITYQVIKHKMQQPSERTVFAAEL